MSHAFMTSRIPSLAHKDKSGHTYSVDTRKKKSLIMLFFCFAQPKRNYKTIL